MHKISSCVMISRIIKSMWWRVLAVHCVVISLWCWGINMLGCVVLMMITSNVIVWHVARSTSNARSGVINFRG